jgi:hypothetical protein
MPPHGASYLIKTGSVHCELFVPFVKLIQNWTAARPGGAPGPSEKLENVVSVTAAGYSVASLNRNVPLVGVVKSRCVCPLSW